MLVYQFWAYKVKKPNSKRRVTTIFKYQKLQKRSTVFLLTQLHHKLKSTGEMDEKIKDSRSISPQHTPNTQAVRIPPFLDAAGSINTQNK